MSERQGTSSGRGRPGIAVERVRDRPPADGAWRGDSLGVSHHSRLLDELRPPLEDRDPDRAAALCATASRVALGDLSPALILLPEAERRRVQALATYVLTLYDFVRQTGLEGERLSRVNRWEFELDSALEGAPTGQPVFVALADQHRRRPWDTDGLDRLHGCARHRIAIPRPSTPEAARKDSLDLASALVSTLLGNPPTTDAVELVAAHLRLAGLRNLGEALRRHRPTLPVSELAETWHTAPALRREAVSEAVAREAVRLRVIFEATTSSFVALPGEYRGSARFLRSAGLRLVSEIDRRGGEVAESPPGLGAGARIWLLLKASMGRSF